MLIRPRFPLALALFSALLIASWPVKAQSGQDEATLWRLLQGGGHIVLIRHAQTVAGVGDPADFKLDDCSTQRNLSEQGQADATRIGQAFRARGVPVDAVYSSRWCRCLDTARLAFGEVTPAPWLDSMFNSDQETRRQGARVALAALAQRSGQGNVVLVTHAANIQAMAGVSPASGEMVVVLPDGRERFTVLGRIGVPQQ